MVLYEGDRPELTTTGATPAMHTLGGDMPVATAGATRALCGTELREGDDAHARVGSKELEV